MWQLHRSWKWRKCIFSDNPFLQLTDSTSCYLTTSSFVPFILISLIHRYFQRSFAGRILSDISISCKRGFIENGFGLPATPSSAAFSFHPIQRLFHPWLKPFYPIALLLMCSRLQTRVRLSTVRGPWRPTESVDPNSASTPSTPGSAKQHSNTAWGTCVACLAYHTVHITLVH